MNKRYFFFLMAIGFSLLQLEAKPLHLDSIKVYIPFYGNFNDWSGWNNNGISGNSNLGVDRNGNSERAFELSDSVHFLAVPAKNTQVTSFTYMQWVRLNERPSQEGFTVFETGDTNCRHSLRLFPKGQDSVIMRYQIPFGNGDSIVEMEGRLLTNQWHHLSVLRSKDSVYLYMDVLFNAEFHVPGIICHAGDYIHYGANLDSGQMLDGSLDEIRVYSENIEPSLLLSIVQGERLDLDGDYTRQEVLIYPNPTNGEFIVSSNLEFDAVSIYSLDGVLHFRQSALRSQDIRITHNLPTGIYLLYLQNGSDRVATHKLVIN